MEKTLLLMSIVVLVVLVKILKQDILSPAAVNVYWNSFFIVGAVVLFDAGIEWEYEGIWWILVSCIFFLTGQMIGGYIRLRQVRDEINAKSNYNYIEIILAGIVLLGMGNPLIYLKAFGYSVGDLFHIQTLLQLNTEVAYDRYYGHRFSAPAITVILSIVIYMGALIGGYVFGMTRRLSRKLLSFATIIPVLFLAIITNAKVGVIACVFLWIIGWGVYSLNRKKTGKLLSTKLCIIGIIFSIISIAFLNLTMLLRIGSIDAETQMIVNEKLQEYAFGQVQAFSMWFNRMGTTDLELGSNTYMFLTNWLGLTVRKQGVYELMPGVPSNIFTLNRGIITDYGIIGGLVYWGILGGVSGVVYKKVKSGSHNCIGAMVFLSSIYFIVLYGFIISPWIYSSYVLAFVGFAVFLVVLKEVRFNFKR